MAGMHTLDRGLNYVFLQQPGSSSVNGSVCDNSTPLWPCPGLSEDDKSQIETYLLWTMVSSAGGISVNAGAEQIYSTPYISLIEDQKQSVCVGQVHTHKWCLDHQQRQVFAIGEEGCFQSMVHNSGQPQPCCACKALLGNHAFQTAINLDISDNINQKFTPLLFQAAQIAKLCQKHSGLSMIFDKVKHIWQLCLVKYSWCSLTPVACPSQWAIASICTPDCCRHVQRQTTYRPWLHLSNGDTDRAPCPWPWSSRDALSPSIQWMVPWAVVHLPCSISNILQSFWREDRNGVFIKFSPKSPT